MLLERGRVVVRRWRMRVVVRARGRVVGGGEVASSERVSRLQRERRPTHVRMSYRRLQRKRRSRRLGSIAVCESRGQEGREGQPGGRSDRVRGLNRMLITERLVYGRTMLILSLHLLLLLRAPSSDTKLVVLMREAVVLCDPGWVHDLVHERRRPSQRLIAVHKVHRERRRRRRRGRRPRVLQRRRVGRVLGRLASSVRFVVERRERRGNWTFEQAETGQSASCSG